MQILSIRQLFLKSSCDSFKIVYKVNTEIKLLKSENEEIRKILKLLLVLINPVCTESQARTFGEKLNLPLGTNK